MHAQYQDARRRVLDQHPAQQLEAADAWQIQIEQHEVWPILSQPRQCVPSSRSLGNLCVRHGGEQVAQAGTDDA